MEAGRASMVLYVFPRSNQCTHFICEIGNCEPGSPDDVIPHYHSQKEAENAGWTLARDIKGNLVAACDKCRFDLRQRLNRQQQLKDFLKQQARGGRA